MKSIGDECYNIGIATCSTYHSYHTAKYLSKGFLTGSGDGLQSSTFHRSCFDYTAEVLFQLVPDLQHFQLVCVLQFVSVIIAVTQTACACAGI